MANAIRKKLLMTFKNQNENKVSLSIDNPREDLMEEEIKDVMDLITRKNMFAPSELDLVSPVEAKIIVTDTTEYDLA